jgi:nucleotide-binding universal stress UspA family protein
MRDYPSKIYSCLQIIQIGIRSGLDRVCLVAENEEAAKAISGKIEWFASHGSVASGVVTHANCPVLVVK